MHINKQYIICLLLTIGVAQAAILDNLIGSWNVSDGSGTTVKGNTGSSTGTTTGTWITGYNGTAGTGINVLGSGGAGGDVRKMSLTTNTSVNGTTDLTICMWLGIPSTSPGNTYKFMQYSASTPASLPSFYLLSNSVGNQMYTANPAPDYSGLNKYPVTAGVGWNFYCLMRSDNGRNLSIYRQGAFYSSNATTASTSAGTSMNNITFPSNDNSYGVAPQFNVSNVNVWSRQLTNAEILSLNTTGYSGRYPFSSAIVSSITLASYTPLNYTYSFSATPVFTFNVTNLYGNWNASLIINGTSYGTNNSITSNSSYNIYSSAIPIGNEYYWYINASNGSTTNITETRQIYIIGASASSSCVINLGNAYYRPNTCTVFP